MSVLRNLSDCNLMIWECIPSKRNLNNVITFNVPSKTEIKVDDEIHCPQGGMKNSIYKIVSVIEVRPSTLKGMNYVTAKTEWYLN